MDIVVGVPLTSSRHVLGFRGIDLIAPGQPAAFEDYSNSFDPLLNAIYLG